MKVIFSALVFLLACTFATEALILPFNTRNVRRISTKTCSGSAELESYHGSRPRIIYNLKQNGLTDAIATRRMFTPPGRLMPTILRVTGNCCWELYQRANFRGSRKAIRGNGVVRDFIPKSMKVDVCGRHL